MKWTDDLECMLMRTWHRYWVDFEKKMITKRQKYEIAIQQMSVHLEAAKVQYPDDDLSLNAIIVKNKLDSIRKKGKQKIHQYILPQLRMRKQPTGSSTDDNAPPDNPADTGHWCWVDFEKKMI
eukprot:scpid95968/ scgid33741/ 